MTFLSKTLTQNNVYFLTVSKYAQGVQLVSKAPLGGQILKKKQAKNTIAAVQKIENKNFIKLFANVLFLRQRETDTVRTATGKNLTLNKQICASCRRATQR